VRSTLRNPQSFTVITCHFGDLFWINHLVNSIRKQSNNQILKIIVIDQSRSSERELLSIGGVDEVITFPLNELEILALGHDHPSALNRAIRELTFDSTHVLILDSDCFPIDNKWLEHLSNSSEVTLAQDPNKWGLSHPCFMKIPTDIVRNLNFSEGTLELGIDTGRLIGLQTINLGLNPKMLIPKKGFDGSHGDLYLQETILHLGSSSFISSSDPKIQSKVVPMQKRMIMKKIKKGSYSFTFWEKYWFKVLSFSSKFRGAIT